LVDVYGFSFIGKYTVRPMDGMGNVWVMSGEVGGDDTMRAVPLQDDLPLQESREDGGRFPVQEFMAHDLVQEL